MLPNSWIPSLFRRKDVLIAAVGVSLVLVYWILDAAFLTFEQPGADFGTRILIFKGMVLQRRVVVSILILFQVGGMSLLHTVVIRSHKGSMGRDGRYRRLVELSPDAIVIQTKNEITYVNPSGALLFGYAEVGELNGKSVWDFVPSSYRLIFERRFYQFENANASTTPIEMELSRADGQTIHVEATLVPFNDQGQVAFLAVFHDITARKWVEDQIRQRNIELAALNAIAATVSQSLDLDKILKASLKDVLKLDILGDNTQGMIFLVDSTGKMLSLAAQQGAPADHPCLEDPPRIGECLCGLAVQTGQVILSQSCFEDERHTRRWPDMPHHRDVCLPLAVHGKVLGAMDVRIPASIEIGDALVELLSAVADQISVAIENARLFEEVSQQSARLRSLSARLAEAEENERKRLASELHDQVGEGLTAIGINLNLIRKQLASGSTKRLDQYLDDSLRLVERTTEQIRGVMSALRPPILDDYGLVATLCWYGEQFSNRVGIEVEVTSDAPDLRVPSQVESVFFRIATEALTNVAKHANASQAKVRVEFKGETFRLVIVDDGKGFEREGQLPESKDRGWGLLIMSERAESLGGKCWIETPVGNGGTRVIAEIPR